MIKEKSRILRMRGRDGRKGLRKCFKVLATRCRAKAITIKKKPEPAPYKPSPPLSKKYQEKEDIRMVGVANMI